MISIILPTYKEEEGIGYLIEKIQNVMRGKEFEIIVVDDNSPDNTRVNAKAKGAIVIHRIAEKGNIFESIKLGIKSCSGDYIVTMDADLSHPPEKILEMFAYSDWFDIVSCSRYMKDGGITAPFFKRNNSRMINILLRIILNLKYNDITGGFHMMRKETFNKLDFKYPTQWGEFDLELFYRAKQLGLKIHEIPFIYKSREMGQSKTKSLKYAIAYVLRALELRFKK